VVTLPIPYREFKLAALLKNSITRQRSVSLIRQVDLRVSNIVSKGLYAETQYMETGGPPHRPRTSPRGFDPWEGLVSVCFSDREHVHSGIPSFKKSQRALVPVYTASAPVYANPAPGVYGNRSPRYRYGSQYISETPDRIGTYSLSVCLRGVVLYPCRLSALLQEHAVSSTATEQNWPDLVRYCQEYDMAMLQDWDAEIDTLLVFVSLPLRSILSRLSCMLRRVFSLLFLPVLWWSPTSR
jgi:hypothetical protein